MIFPALRRKKKTQKRNQPLSYWIEGWFYLTIEFFNIYYGFLNLLAILNSLMVLFKESICPGVKVLISSTILRSISGFWLSEAKNSSGVISKYLQIYRKPSIEGNFTVTAQDLKHMASHLSSWINVSTGYGLMIWG